MVRPRMCLPQRAGHRDPGLENAKSRRSLDARVGILGNGSHRRNIKFEMLASKHI